MSRLEITLSCILALSLMMNIGVFAYARAAISRLLFVADELGDLQTMVDNFAKHLNAVYELESFYGDQTLQHLLEHAISFNEQLETFEHIYTLTEEETAQIEGDVDAEEEQYDEEQNIATG